MSEQYFVAIGSYATAQEPGIHIYSLDASNGKLTFVEQVTGIENPSYLAFSRTTKRLYAASETWRYNGQPGGSVAAFSFDAERGTLHMLNAQPTQGTDPCYVSVDSQGKTLLVANYSGGSVCAYPLGEQGEIAPASTFIQHEGKGTREDRQEGPHAHSIVLDPNENYALVADLGLDKVITYALDKHTHTLKHQSEVATAPGAGPRHIAFHPSETYVYVINELNATIAAYTYRAEQGELHHLQTVPALPADFQGENICADLHIAPSGRFLYGSNRGHNSIVVYSIEPQSGLLSYVEHVSTQGRTPRNFALTPDGRFLFVANQDSNSIVTYTLDATTGRLTPTGQVIELAKPVCIKMLV